MWWNIDRKGDDAMSFVDSELFDFWSSMPLFVLFVCLLGVRKENTLAFV